jgi:hypothetical protein
MRLGHAGAATGVLEQVQAGEQVFEESPTTRVTSG